MRNFIFAIPALAIGCGIPKDTLLSELTADDWELICGRAITGDETDRVVDCDGTEVTIAANTEAICQEAGATLVAADCAGTLQDWIDCQDEAEPTDEQICDPTTLPDPSAACTAVAGCYQAPATE
jgi:hypothetical protein